MKPTEPSAALAELECIQFEHGHILDDASVELVAALRERGIIDDTEWGLIKSEFHKVLDVLSKPNPTASRDEDGQVVIDPDADPRNADWVRISAASRQAGRHLPLWAALWLWRLWTDGRRDKWRRVGRVAASMGCEPCEDPKHA